MSSGLPIDNPKWGKKSARPGFRHVIGLLSFLLMMHGPSYGDDLPLTLISGSAQQGGLMIYQTERDSLVHLDDKPIFVDENGYFVVGFHRDDADTQTLKIERPDGNITRHHITPETRAYQTQRINGLAGKYVTPPQKLLDRIKADREAVYLARQQPGHASAFLQTGFNWPLAGQITGVYGSQRILNGQPRQPHFGIDIAAPTGTPITAPAAGTVTMVRDLYYTGWTVIITHGHYISSTYSHLEKVSVSKGQNVKSGDQIGLVGSTGRSTGPHLDWRFNWREKRLDPALLVSGPIQSGK